ncbi:hypothetical protein O181_030947 [Austropuccinia psidii MF-1]|uniref:Uncharacterized protein n=1 Tax=Austropuccinia psidii MF-1 TaxID=1389203 RepID=A0A9Q3H4W7_9BASI|nr:hypothetical protein [Austropuccinia psidii MF-1]
MRAYLTRSVPIHRSKEIIEVLNIELASMITKRKLSDQAQLELQCGCPQELSETENTDLLRHLKHPPIEASYELPRSQGDKLLCYLQNLHPMTKGEPIINYWKHQIITCNFPTMGKIALRYLSITVGSAWAKPQLVQPLDQERLPPHLSEGVAE